MEAEDLIATGPVTDEVGDRLIADRLDALEAEQVIGRALELEAASHDGAHVITTEQLERIAKEIGVDPAFVHQALGEVKLQGRERGRLDRFILPDDLIEMENLRGMTRADAEAAVERWMVNYEGLIRGSHLAGGAHWDVDRRWAAKLRSGSLNGGNRISRVAGGDIAHRMQTVASEEHVVALESKGEGPLLLAKAAMFLAGAVIVLGAAGSVGSGFVPFLQNLAAATVFGAGIAVAGTAGARRWARAIRHAFRRSLTGLAANAKPRAKRSRGWFSRKKKQQPPND